MMIRPLFLCFVLCAAAYSRAQSVAGSSSIDVDASTNAVTATCETDNDDADYEASVTCIVFDDNDTVVASAGNVDHADQGYAQVVVSFMGQPGTNYTVQATHVAVSNITDLPENHVVYYDDPYNYSYFQTEGEASGFPPYEGFYEWYGPGPDTETKQKNIQIGKTTATAASAPKVTIKFSGNKSSSDSLAFGVGSSGTCSENLGYIQCNNSGLFRYNYEGGATVRNASHWTVAQSIVSQKLTVQCADGTTQNQTIAAGPDGPQAAFTQTVNGSPVFWLDSPGFGTVCSNGSAVFNAKAAWNFKVNVCSTIKTSVCGSTTYYTSFVVSSGALTSGSTGGTGAVPLNF